MKLRSEKVVVNKKVRNRYYVNEQRCSKEQYEKLLKHTNEKLFEGDTNNILCKINRCHMKWIDLTPTFIEGVRFCNQCNERVHMCKSWTEVEQLGKQGMCVAIRQPWTVTLGFPIVS